MSEAFIYQNFSENLHQYWDHLLILWIFSLKLYDSILVHSNNSDVRALTCEADNQGLIEAKMRNPNSVSEVLKREFWW